MGKTLAVPSTPFDLVFRALVAALRADPNFTRVVGVENLRAWEGESRDKLPFTPGPGKPVVRLTPMPRSEGWYDPSAQLGELYVLVEIAVQSTCSDDVGGLWRLITNALNPANLPAVDALKAAGAETGEIVFLAPPFDPSPDPNTTRLNAVGGMALRVVDQF